MIQKKIKICFIIHNLKSGGAERQFVELIKNIDKTRFSPTLFLYAISNEKTYPEIYETDQLEIIKKKLRSKNKLLKIIEAIISIRKFLNKHSFDLVQSTLFMNGFLVRIAAPGFYNNKLISSIRTSFDSYGWFYRFSEKSLLKRSFVIANTQKTANDFSQIVRKDLRHRISFIYNGFDQKRFIFDRGNFNPNHIIIGNIGRKVRQKNQIQLLRVFKKLNKPNIELMIIGKEGEQSLAINDYIISNNMSEKVKVYPMQNNIEEIYKKINIFILTSIYEGCPNVLFEAMLSNCICIISESANTDNFIVDGVNGFVYDNSDSGLSYKMELCIDLIKRNQISQIVENGQEYAKKNFSMSQMISSYERYYMKLFQTLYA